MARRKPAHLKVNSAKSKKKLFADLDYLTGNPGWGLNCRNIGSENFGRTSCIYISTGSNKRKLELERKLHKMGHRVCFDYWPGSGFVEVEVTYFKGADRVD